MGCVPYLPSSHSVRPDSSFIPSAVAAHQHSAPTPSLLSLVLVSLRFTSLLVLTLTLTFPHVIARRSPPVAVVPVAAETKEDDKDEDKDQITTWAVFFERLWKLSPYLWPSDSLKLKFFSFLCLVVVVVGRGCLLLDPPRRNPLSQ